MAAPLRGTSQSAENVSDLLSCSVCMESFGDTDHLPKLLLCHHTFCVQCLVRLAKQNQFVNCPTCRHNTVLNESPPGGLFALQTNFYIQQMRELIGDVARLKVWAIPCQVDHSKCQPSEILLKFYVPIHLPPWKLQLPISRKIGRVFFELHPPKN